MKGSLFNQACIKLKIDIGESSQPKKKPRVIPYTHFPKCVLVFASSENAKKRVNTQKIAEKHNNINRLFETNRTSQFFIDSFIIHGLLNSIPCFNNFAAPHTKTSPSHFHCVNSILQLADSCGHISTVDSNMILNSLMWLGAVCHVGIFSVLSRETCEVTNPHISVLFAKATSSLSSSSSNDLN